MQTTIKLPKIRTDLPGPKAAAIVEKDHRYVSPSYTRPYPLVIKRGEGAIIEDVDGNYFLDFNAGVAVCTTGHSHPKIVETISKQAGEFIHLAAADYYYPQLAELAEKLEQSTPGNFPKRTHFGNSGAEAVECALKVARYATKRDKFIAFYGAFHGRTIGALSLTCSKPTQRRGFGRAALDVTHIPFPNPLRWPYRSKDEDCGVEAIRFLEDVVFKSTCPPDEVAAIVLEPVQGEGGYVVPPRSLFAELNRIREKYGILIIADEVQSGMGRTGKMWACDHFDFVPDIITVAKGIASGLPLSATVARADLMNWHAGAHASTFGGNPVAIAASLTTFELLETGLLEHGRAMGDRLMNGLKQVAEKHSDCIAEVRGLGLMIGVELVKNRATLEPAPQLKERVVKESFNRGLVLLGCGDSAIRFSPPLIVDGEQVDCAVQIFDEVIAASKAA
jgi:4-aminobutyrate aminotransferase